MTYANIRLLSIALLVSFAGCRNASVDAEVTRIAPNEGGGAAVTLVTSGFTNRSSGTCRLKSYFLEDEPHKLEEPGMIVAAGQRAEHTTPSQRISPKASPKEVKVRDVSCPSE